MIQKHFSETFVPSSGISKSQNDVLQLGSTEVAKGYDPGVGEISSASDYLTCVSSPLKLIRSGKSVGLLGCMAGGTQNQA